MLPVCGFRFLNVSLGTAPRAKVTEILKSPQTGAQLPWRPWRCSITLPG